MGQWRKTWESAQWRAEAAQWIGLVLDNYGLAQTGALEQPRVHPWSIQLLVPTDHGRLWFKENNPGQRAEASVVAAIARLDPEHVVMPLAIDPQRGWMLSPDYGATLSSLNSQDYQLWSKILTDFAVLQRALVPFTQPLFEAGLQRQDPAWIPGYVEDQLEFHFAMPADHPLHLGAESADRIIAQLPEITAMAQQLCAGAVPLSLDHCGLHHNNAFIPGQPDEPLRFIDFADAIWGHPFGSLLQPVSVMRRQWEAGPDDARIRRVTTAYLDQWKEYGSTADLRPLLEPAMRLARLNRYTVRLNVLACCDEDELAEYAPLAMQDLQTLMQPVMV